MIGSSLSALPRVSRTQLVNRGNSVKRKQPLSSTDGLAERPRGRWRATALLRRLWHGRGMMVDNEPILAVLHVSEAVEAAATSSFGLAEAQVANDNRIMLSANFALAVLKEKLIPASPVDDRDTSASAGNALQHLLKPLTLPRTSYVSSMTRRRGYRCAQPVL
jgi:hypothetical protein